jgi:hypothetical protein
MCCFLQGRTESSEPRSTWFLDFSCFLLPIECLTGGWHLKVPRLAGRILGSLCSPSPLQISLSCLLPLLLSHLRYTPQHGCLPPLGYKQRDLLSKQDLAQPRDHKVHSSRQQIPVYKEGKLLKWMQP